MKEHRGVRAFFENLIILAIILVLVQTFLEDFAILAEWSWEWRRILILAGFGFDLLFTVEFLTRFIGAAFKKRAGEYFFRNRGWIDFLASIPLLLFNSGPQAAALLLGGTAVVGLSGVLNILKVVKAVRIARILRLLRILKIFRQIKYADSPMAQRHITWITTITISTIVFLIFLYSAAASLTGLPASDAKYNESFENTALKVAENLREDRERTALEIAEAEKDLLIVKHRGDTVYSRFDNEYYRNNFGPADYRYARVGNFGFFFDLRTALKQQSRENLLFFIIVVVLVAAFMVIYSPHFAMTVTDPIHVMEKGFEDPTYNLEVKIPPNYASDDVFRLASLYNEEYLPLKDRAGGEEDGSPGGLSMDDFGDLFDSDVNNE
jgi:hypothetical protein